MKNEGIPVAKEGLPFCLLATVAFFLSLFLKIWLLSVLLLIFALFCFYFFRNPERLSPVGSQLVVSPADGKVVYVGHAFEKEFLNEETIKISIFMSLWDVHINRMPIDGVVKDLHYHSGKFLAAFDEIASEVNERQALLIESSQNSKLVLFQVAGLIARRIVTYPRSGTFLLKGQRLGLIRFGSRCDLYIPKSAKVMVKVGDKVLGGESLLAQLQETLGEGDAQS